LRRDEADSELIGAWLGGDKDAFAEIYDRYSDGLYAFAMSRLRNRAEAADVVQETFVRAAANLAQLRDRSRLRPWLYAIARNGVIDVTRRPMSYVDAEEFAEMPADQPELADAVARSELAELVWLAAEGLTPRDREMLGLHLRHGLDGADLADVVGVSPANLYVAMGRLKERMAKAVGALLIARHGSKDCAELAMVLGDWDGTFSLDVRSKVTRHVERCSDCTKRRAALITATSLSAGSFAIPLIAPAHVRGLTLDHLDHMEPGVVSLDGGRGAGPRQPSGQWRADGFPSARHGRSRGIKVAVTAACVVGALVAVVTLASRDQEQRESLSPDSVVAAATGTAAVPSAASAVPPLTTGTTLSATAVATTLVPPSIDPSTIDPAATLATTIVDATSTSIGPTATITPEVAEGIHPSSTSPTIPVVPGSSVVAGPGVPTTFPPSSSPAPPAGTTPDVAPPTQTTAPDSTVVDPVVTATTTPAPPPPAPGRIVVIGGPFDFGLVDVSRTASLRNDGGQIVNWSASPGLAGFSVSPSGGSLGPGEVLDIQISVQRASLPEGSQRTDVIITSPGGGGSISVAARVERAPVIGSFVRTPPVVRTSGSCGPTLVNLSLTASDESGIASVEVVWSSDGSFAQRTTLTPSGSGNYVAVIGSFSNLGTNSFTAHVLDTRGNASTAAASVTVIAC
jgi:RNA polymerase sigma factor (sigma-70 family)